MTALLFREQFSKTDTVAEMINIDGHDIFKSQGFSCAVQKNHRTLEALEKFTVFIKEIQFEVIEKNA